MDKLEVPVYLITGFLESGKTSFLQEIFESGEFADGEKGLLISCEEGEVELDEKATMASTRRMVVTSTRCASWSLEIIYNRKNYEHRTTDFGRGV